MQRLSQNQGETMIDLCLVICEAEPAGVSACVIADVQRRRLDG
jgi:hypothetical protein